MTLGIQNLLIQGLNPLRPFYQMHVTLMAIGTSFLCLKTLTRVGKDNLKRPTPTMHKNETSWDKKTLLSHQDKI